jgi:hypothetical protein
VLIGLALGFSAGVLLTAGIFGLLNANSTTQTSSQVGNGGATANAILTPTPTPTFTPTPTPSPSPTPSPTPADNSAAQLLAPDDPRFYILVFIAFVILAGLLLANTPKK